VLLAPSSDASCSTTHVGSVSSQLQLVSAHFRLICHLSGVTQNKITMLVGYYRGWLVGEARHLRCPDVQLRRVLYRPYLFLSG